MQEHRHFISIIMPPSRKLYVVTLLILLSGTTISFAQTKADKISTLLLNLYEKGLFNGNVLVADHDKIVYQAAVGFADTSHHNKLSVAYRFHIGSIAKEFNAAGIMMLQEQGKLNVNDKISRYLPDLPSWAHDISIKNLLQYTSGLPDVEWATVKTDADNLENLRRLGKLNFAPGSQYAYNNNNVFLQRRIIEKVTGLSFNEFVQEKMFKPCAMDHATLDPVQTDAFVAKSFNDQHRQDPLTVPISGWASVTLDDFYKWAQCIAHFRLISPASTKEILIPFSPGNQSGLGGGSMNGDSMISHIHDGSAYNYQALLTCHVPKGRFIILMSNNKQDNEYEIAGAIEAILDGKAYIVPRQSILKRYQAAIDTMNGAQVLKLYRS